MKWMQPWSGALAVGLLAVLGYGVVPQAQAADVYWSIGVQSGPAPAVVVPSRPAYPPPRVVYALPPPPPVAMPPVVVISPGYAVPAARWDDPRDRRDGRYKHHHWHDRYGYRDDRRDDRRAPDATCYHQDVGYFDCRRGPR